MGLRAAEPWIVSPFAPATQDTESQVSPKNKGLHGSCSLVMLLPEIPRYGPVQGSALFWGEGGLPFKCVETLMNDSSVSLSEESDL